LVEGEQATIEQCLEANYAYTDALIAQAELRADKAAQLDLSMDEERQAIIERSIEENWAYTDTLIAQAEARADAAKKTHAEMLTDEQATIEQSTEANYAYTDALIALAELRADRAAQADRRMNEERQVVLDESLEANYAYTDKLIAQAEARADAAQQAHEEIVLGIQSAQDNVGPAGGSSKGVENFFTTENITRLAQFVVLWKLLSEVINGVVKALESPFKALESGVQYLQQLEAKADELTGVLDANVRFSGDLAENFKQASEAAPAVVKALQDAAIAAHLNPDQLGNIFKALANNGAAAGVTDLQQLVQLTTMYGMALKASGASAQSVQRAVMEIPKAMEGTLPPTSKWLQVLGLTNDQWVVLRDQGLKYQDLVERIADLPSMKAHLEALGKMKDDYQSATEAFGLLVKRIEGAGAESLFNAVKGWVKELNDWVTKNEAALTKGLRDLADSLVSLTNSIIKLLAAFAELPGAGLGAKLLATVFQGLSDVIGGMAANIRFALVGLKELATWELHPNDSIQRVGEAAAQWKKDQLALADATYQNMQKVWGHDTSPVNPNPLATPIGNKTPGREDKTTPVTEFKKVFDSEKTEFMDGVEEIKNKYKDLNNATAESVAARSMSHKKAAELTKKYGEEEIGALAEMKAALDIQATAARRAIENSPATTKAEKDKKTGALLSFDKDQETFERSYQALIQGIVNTESTAQKAANTEAFTIQQDHFKAMIALREDAAKNELAVVKFQVSNGYLTEVDGFDRETALLLRQRQIKVDADNAELKSLGEGTAEKAALIDKMTRAEGQYTEEAALRSQQRIALVEKERVARVEYNDKIRSAALEQSSSAATIGTEVSPHTALKADEGLFAAKERELEILIREKEQTLENARAKSAESAETRKLALELQGLYNQRFKDAGARISQVNQTIPANLRGVVDPSIIRDARSRAQLAEGDAANNLNKFDRKNPTLGGVSGTTIDSALLAQRNALVSVLEAAQNELTKWDEALEESSASLGSLINKVAGFNVTGAWKGAREQDGNASDSLNNNTKYGAGGVTGYDHEIAVAGEALANTFKSLANTFLEIQQQWRSGNIAGAIGTGLSTVGSDLTAAGIPVAGTIVSAVGSIMSTIGSLFTAAAAHIAEDIQKEEQATMLLYSTKQADLVETIASLQQEETSAIQQLSGTKGGQDQLNKILPGLEQQIASLQQQAQNTLDTFQFMTENLQMQNNTLTQVNQEWESINQQVADYLSAGGKAATAQQALSSTLQQMQIQAQNSLNQANDTAVQDAISLNGLLEQRLQLTMQYNQQVFAVVNQGSIQRKAGAISQGQQLEQLAAQYAQQMTDLNSQISLAQQKVALEGQVFDIATNINDLHTQDAALQIDALNQQILQWKALQEIVTDISKSASGGFTVAPGLFNQLPTTVIAELQLSGYTLTATGQLQPNGYVTAASGSPSLGEQLAQAQRNSPSGF